MMRVPQFVIYTNLVEARFCAGRVAPRYAPRAAPSPGRAHDRGRRSYAQAHPQVVRTRGVGCLRVSAARQAGA